MRLILGEDGIAKYIKYMKYLLPFIRANRAFASTLIYPQHPLQAIAISEVVSVFGPLLNKDVYSKIIGFVIAITYVPQFSSLLLEIYNKQNKIYHQAEICCLLLFILYSYV